MIRGIYASGTSMLTQQKKLDVISNNIANSTTTGFKSDELVSSSFKDMMISATNDASIVNKTREVGPYNTGIHIDQVYTNFLTGAIAQTGVSTDVAIQGDGFFAVNTNQGERYTRDGSFKIDNNGYLVTQNGESVLGENGRIYIGDNDFSVSKDGSIYTNGNYVNRLRVVEFDNLEALRKEGTNLYTNNGANIIASNSTVVQKSLEQSNVSIVDEMVNMIKLSRNYETNQKVIQVLDGTLDKAVNEIGRV